MSDSFVYELPLETAPVDEDTVFVRFRAGNSIYNACLGESLKRLDLARQSVFWQEAKKTPPGKKKSGLFRFALKHYRFGEYEMHKFVRDLVKGCWL